MPDSTPRLGLINHGGFFSPYYLFELLERQHGDELDPLGREANRKPLRRVYRKAEERLAAGSTAGEAWSAWHRELLEALGFTGEVIRRLESPVETARHGEVPISHGAFLPTTDDGQATTDDEILRGEAAQNDTPLVFIDCHGFGVDLDRNTYTQSAIRNRQSEITDEVISRAIEFALDHNATRWALVLAGSELRLYRKGGSVARQYLQVNFPALFDADRADEWTAFWGLFRFAAFVPEADGKCLLDRVLEESQRHASRIADDLRENVVIAVEAIMQGILDDPANAALTPGPSPTQGEGRLAQLFEETLYFLYRVLFVLYAESRDLLPVTDPIYRDTYSLEHLRDLAERPLSRDEGDRTYFSESLRTLFAMLHDGFPRGGMRSSFSIDPFNGQLFDPRRTALLDRCRIPDRALHTAIAELSLSRPRRRSDRRERFSYADLGVDQLGSIYEGLLVYEPAIVTEDTVLARVKGEERWLPRSQAEANRLEIVEGTLRRSGQFVLRLWGGRRKGSGSYYTPQEITSFLVKEALEPLVAPIIAACSPEPSPPTPLPAKARGARPEDILELKVCDPAMGSGAFLIQACRYLAEAYGRARIAAGEDDDGRISQEEFAKHKRLVAERCLYGVDLNPMAVELAKVSLWLETLARGKPLDFLDAHLRCGNSLIGAPLRDAEGRFSVERLLSVPEAALKEVSKEASKEAKAAARERIKKNKEEVKRLHAQQSGQLGFGFDWGTQSFQQIEAALTETVLQRATFERVDVDLPPAEAVALIHEKEQVFERLQSDPQSAYVKVRALCDLWCAIWFWPPSPLHPSPHEGEGTGVRVDRPTTQVYLELIGALLGTDEGSLSVEQREAYWRTVKAVWRELRFFHWELEFPEVWREKNGRLKQHGGFDAIVGNPPWDKIKPNQNEFFSQYSPVMSAFDAKRNKATRRRLLEDGNVATEFFEYMNRFARISNFFGSSGQYQHQACVVDGKSQGGDDNAYMLFVERSTFMLRPAGLWSIVLPNGFAGDLGSGGLRHLIITAGSMNLWKIRNKNIDLHIFPNVAPQAYICLANFCRDSRGLLRVKLCNGIGNLIEPFSEKDTYEREEILSEFPQTADFISYPTEQDRRLAKKLLRHPPLSAERPLGWGVTVGRELDITNDAYLFLDEPTSIPLWEGSLTLNFEMVEKPKRFVDPDQFSKLQLVDSQHYRIVLRSILSDGARKVQCTIVPPHYALGNSLNYIKPDTSRPFIEDCLLTGIINSFVIEYRVQQTRSGYNLNHFRIRQLPAPKPASDNPKALHLAANVLRLVCADPRLSGLWTYIANDLETIESSLPTANPRERAQLRAEIDALVADLYGLSESDFAYILSTFPLLDRDQPALPGEPKSYITRDMALLELFKLRGKVPPEDIVAFHREAGVEIASITGEVRSLAERVRLAVEAGAIAYVPSGRGGKDEGGGMRDEEEELTEEDEE